MENRFGLKDFVLLVLLAALIGSVWLAMKQYDRQWRDVQELKTQVSQLVSEQAQTRNEISAVHELLEDGVSFVPAAPSGDGAPPAAVTSEYDPFDRIKEARKAPDFAQGDWLIDAFPSKVGSITALVYKDLYGRWVQEQVLEGLIGIDLETLETVPHIARSWQVKDNTTAWKEYMAGAREKYGKSADEDPAVYAEQLKALLAEAAKEAGAPPAEGSPQHAEAVAKARQQWIDAQIAKDPHRPAAVEVTFQLRRGVRFSDGHPLTAADVVFTLELLQNPELDAASQRQFYDNIERAEARGDYEVTFFMKEPHYLAVSMCGGRGVLPKHFFEKFTIEQINRHPGLLVGTGPYRLPDPEQGWRPGEPLELVRNERYWGPQGGFDKIIWREVTNDVARLTMYVNGEIDYFRATPEQFEQLKSNPQVAARSHMLAYNKIPSGYLWIAWQQFRDGKSTMFADKRVRQAMTYLTDREWVSREIYKGYAYPTSGPFTPGSPQADPNVEPYPYDPVKARQLLKEAGWEDRNGDGVLENRSGQPFKFALTYPSGSVDFDRIVLFLKDSYARAGIVMDLDPLEFSVLLDRLEQQTFDAITLRWGGGAVEADIRQMFHSSQTFKGGDNVMNYRSTELDALIDEARTTLDDDARMKLWQACHRILHEDQPYTFMTVRQELRLVDKRIHNVQVLKADLNDVTRNEWYVPSPMQKYGR